NKRASLLIACCVLCVCRALDTQHVTRRGWTRLFSKVPRCSTVPHQRRRVEAWQGPLQRGLIGRRGVLSADFGNGLNGFVAQSVQSVPTIRCQQSRSIPTSETVTELQGPMSGVWRADMPML